jgi:hypothetical protein
MKQTTTMIARLNIKAKKEPSTYTKTPKGGNFDYRLTIANCYLQ